MNILHTLPLPRSTWRLAALLTLLLAALTLSPTLVSANSPPQAPSSVTVTRADGTLTATWTAVAGAVGYHVTYSSDGKRSWTAAAANHPDTTITFSVKNSATYVVAVRARTPRGYSGWRNSAPSGPFQSPPTPTIPHGLRAHSGNMEATLTWYNPWDVTIIRYEYQYREAPPGAGWSAWTTVPNSTRVTTSFTKTGLTNGKEYHFKLRAVNSNGAGDPTPRYVSARPADEEASIPKPPGTPPPPTPASVTVTRSDGMLSASWPGDDLAISYHVTYTSDGGASWTLAALNHPRPAITITNVSDSATYVVAVRARNDSGDSGWRNSAPIAPLTPEITFTNVTATTATLNLANHNSAWYYKQTAPTVGTCSTVISAGTNSKTITGLNKSASYTFGAYSDSGCSDVLATASLTTLTPSLAVSNVGTSTLTLTLSNWSITQDGSWYYRGVVNGQSYACAGPISSTTTTAQMNLTANKTYSVTAYSVAGCTTEIDTVYFSTTDVSVGNLGEPLNSSYGVVGGSSRVHWATAFTTGAATNGYTLNGVTLRFGNRGGSPGSISVDLHDASSGGEPDTRLAALSGSDPNTAGLYTYDCSTNCGLSASSTYFIVVSELNNVPGNYYRLGQTASGDEVRRPAGNGWSIADSGLYKAGSSSSAQWGPSEDIHVMHVSANVNTGISSNMNATLSRGD